MKNCFETIEIAPAVRLCSYETDRFTNARIGISFAMPLDKDRISDISMIPFLLCRSSEDYPSFIEVSRRAYELYGADIHPYVTKQGDNHIVGITLELLDNRFALEGEDIALEGAKFLFDMVFRPNLRDGGFVSEELEIQRRIASEKVMSLVNDKRLYAKYRLEKEMFAGENFAEYIHGTPEGIAAATPQSVYAAYGDMLRGGRVQLSTVGSADPKAIADLFAGYLESIEREPYMLFSSIVATADEVKHVSEEMPVNQGKLVMGFRLGMADPEADYPKYKMMCSLFGAGVHSRLFNVVREQMSLCYYCSSSVNRKKGYMLVQSGLENDNAEVAEKEILNQLRYVAESSTEDDLEKARLSIADEYKSICDTPDMIAGWIDSQCLDDEIETPEQHVASLMAITLDDVKSAAAAVTLDTVYMLRAEEVQL
ncbi:MAG: insulinase family protein [Clostridiales bacterium]|nr:insulinase family protein [Clostridiales bacterium]